MPNPYHDQAERFFEQYQSLLPETRRALEETGATDALSSLIDRVGSRLPGMVGLRDFDVLPKFAGPKVIYAATNRMGGRGAREGITFKQTPYELEV